MWRRRTSVTATVPEASPGLSQTWKMERFALKVIGF